MRGQQKNITPPVELHICTAIEENLFEIMDWVGTTEQLSNETIPLLSKLLNIPSYFIWENSRVSKNNHVCIISIVKYVSRIGTPHFVK